MGKALVSRLSRNHSTFWTYFQSGSQSDHSSRLLDIRNQRDVKVLFKEVQPDIVYHLAYHMDDLEGSIVEGTWHVLKERAELNRPCRFIFVSTDAVFDGETPPYGETHEPHPVFPYGKAKKAAERMVLDHGGNVVRISLVYGLIHQDPRTKILLEGLRSGRFQYPYFEDEVRSPIFVDDLCEAFVELGEGKADNHRILHVAGPEGLNRHEFAKRILECYGYRKIEIPKGLLSESGFVRPRDVTLDIRLAKSLLDTRFRNVEEVREALVPQNRAFKRSFN